MHSVARSSASAAYLLKPVRQTELREAISRILSGREAAGTTSMITRDTPNREEGVTKPMRILLAEDNFVNQKLAKRMLEKRNHLLPSSPTVERPRQS